uniref:CUB domain-containing protein n=1 Tax=Caenorhabditis tropicalis TaxID=1561998 RepID=A0A1I7U030_9PELO
MDTECTPQCCRRLPMSLKFPLFLITSLKLSRVQSQQGQRFEYWFASDTLCDYDTSNEQKSDIGPKFHVAFTVNSDDSVCGTQTELDQFDLSGRLKSAIISVTPVSGFKEQK